MMANRRCGTKMGCVVVVLSAMLLMAGGPGHALKTNDMWLITPQEAALAPALEASQDGTIPIEAESELGPKIVIVKPANGGSAPPPVEVDIQFIPKLSPIDLASLKVSVVKLINIDITDRVRSHVSDKGIHVPEAQLPSGKHKVRISIADKEGLRSVKDVIFEVVEGKS